MPKYISISRLTFDVLITSFQLNYVNTDEAWSKYETRQFIKATEWFVTLPIENVNRAEALKPCPIQDQCSGRVLHVRVNGMYEKSDG